MRSGFPAVWSGCTAIALAVFILIAVAAIQVGFSQLGLLVSFILGLAMIIEAF